MKKRKYSLWMVGCIVVLTAALSSALMAFYMMGGIAGGTSPLQKYARLETMRQVLEKHYYLDVDDETLLNGALKGMLSSLNDPYTYYITPGEAQQRAESESMSYMGLGMTVQLNDNGQLEVVDVTEKTPAANAGVLSGDIITEINGTVLDGKSLDEAVHMIRSTENEPVVLVIHRGEDELKLSIVCEPIPISNVNSAILEGDIGYVYISQFAGTDVEDFSHVMESFKAEGVKGLIVDLRDNPGGYLDHVSVIADQLLPEALIVYTQDRSGKRVDHYSDAEYWDIPLCVLINERSASASEIFTAAIKDNGRGTVIGTTTYGKGIVQSVYTFEDDGAAMQFTSSTYYTPGGVCIHGTGVTPDIEEEDPDKQLTTALELLNEKNEA